MVQNINKNAPISIAFFANNAMALYKFRMGAMQAFKKMGMNVYAIAPVDNYSSKIENAGISFLPIEMVSSGTNWWSDILLFFRTWFLYRKIAPSLVVHYTIKPNIFGSWAAKLAGCTAISVIPGRGHSFHKKNWLFYLAKLLYKISLKHVKEVWFLNKEDLEFFTNEGIVESSKIGLMPGEGIDTDYYHPDFNDTIPSLEYASIKFLFAGRILWEKGIGEFVEAARRIKERHKNAEFQVMGFLDEMNKRSVTTSKMMEWVNEGTITYLGEQEDVRPFLKACDCFVVPSFYGEGMPRTLLEAASMSKPIITTDNIGCREVVDNNISGYLCHPKDIDDLEKMMLKFMTKSIPEMEAMGKAGRKKMLENFKEEYIVEFYLERIKRLLNLKFKTNNVILAKSRSKLHSI